MPRKGRVRSKSTTLSYFRVTDVHRLDLGRYLKVQMGGGVESGAGLCLFLPLEYSAFHSLLFQSAKLSSTSESSCICRPVSFIVSSPCMSCPRCSPPRFPSLPRHSHVSLMFFLLAFIALPSSTHRVPRCHPPPDTHFRSSFPSFVHIKLVSGSWRQLGRIPLSSIQWA